VTGLPDDADAHGILVTVDIRPLECVSRCVGELAQTGGDATPLLTCAAAALIAVGILIVLQRMSERTAVRDSPEIRG
jgi:hypothetical protein